MWWLAASILITEKFQMAAVKTAESDDISERHGERT